VVYLFHEIIDPANLQLCCMHVGSQLTFDVITQFNDVTAGYKKISLPC